MNSSDYLVDDLNSARGFSISLLNSVLEKYGAEIVDFYHTYPLFTATVSMNNSVYVLIYIKPKKRWYLQSI